MPATSRLPLARFICAFERLPLRLNGCLGPWTGCESASNVGFVATVLADGSTYARNSVSAVTSTCGARLTAGRGPPHCWMAPSSSSELLPP